MEEQTGFWVQFDGSYSDGRNWHVRKYTGEIVMTFRYPGSPNLYATVRTTYGSEFDVSVGLMWATA